MLIPFSIGEKKRDKPSFPPFVWQTLTEKWKGTRTFEYPLLQSVCYPFIPYRENRRKYVYPFWGLTVSLSFAYTWERARTGRLVHGAAPGPPQEAGCGVSRSWVFALQLHVKANSLGFRPGIWERRCCFEDACEHELLKSLQYCHFILSNSHLGDYATGFLVSLCSH